MPEIEIAMFLWGQPPPAVRRAKLGQFLLDHPHRPALFQNGPLERIRSRVRNRLVFQSLVLQNKDKLPQLPPLSLDQGGLHLIELFVLLEFALRLCSLSDPLVSQTEPVMRLAASRVRHHRLLISGNRLLKSSARKI